MSAQEKLQDNKNVMPEAPRTKIKSKEDIGKAVEPDFMGGGRLQIPEYIQKELDEAGLVPRFVALKKLTENGGFHPMGWTPYTVKNPVQNPITGQAERVFRVGDLVLAVKTKEAHKKHKEYLAKRSASQSNTQKESVKAMRDKIREGKADKHISLIEGYDEGDDEE